MLAGPLTPQRLLAAYAQGAFPMTDEDGLTRWYTADPRGVIPLHEGNSPREGFYIPRSLRQVLRSGRYDVRLDTDFAGTMHDCMHARRRHERGTWISAELMAAYRRLHTLGFAHSVEAWHEGERVGGLYGVALGGAFFGESMFHHPERGRDASKVCLVHLVRRLRERDYLLLDTQAVTPHLAQFGARALPADEYLRLLDDALKIERTFI